MRTPDGVERLGAAESWQDGYRQGREDLALEMQRDALAAAAAEAPDAKRLLDERIAKVESRVIVLEGDVGDAAAISADLVRRVAELEGKTTVDDDTGKDRR